MRWIAIIFCSFLFTLQAQNPSFEIALLKYNGGGDWYANPTALPNLIEFCNQELNMNIAPEPATVEVGSPELFNYPFVHMTGHGNVVLSAQENENLRAYLISGGFLHIDDNYGMDKFVRPVIRQLFPEASLVEIPFGHEVYHQTFSFKNGVPKIHEHDDQPPKGYGVFFEGRMVIYYSYESDLGDGWEDQSVHNDPPELRQLALQMGANLVQYALSY